MSTPEQDREAIEHIKAELEYYDKHPTTVPEIFIPQDMLRRLVQIVEGR